MLKAFLGKGIIMLSLQDLDHEFIGRGDPHVESLRLRQQYEQNLTPEELQRLVEISPVVNEFMALDFKGRTGTFPEGQRDMDINQVPENEQMDLEEYGRMRGLDEEYIDEVMTGVNGPKEVFMGDAPPVNKAPIMGDAPPVNKAPIMGDAPPQGLALGTDDLQQQEQIQGMPPVQEVLPGAGTGLIQDPIDPNASPVADTVPMDNVEEGSAIINAAAVKIVGLKDLMKAREEARDILRSQGTIIDDEKQYQGDGVDIATSNGEFKFSAKESEIIGKETIDKWNKKGEAETEEAIANEQAQNPNQVGVQPVMGAREGMIVENPPPPQQKPIVDSTFVDIIKPAVIQVESTNRPDAVSKKGAVGLMQVTPIAVKDVLIRGNNKKQHTPETLPTWLKKNNSGEYDMKDAETNKWFGTQYLNMMYKQFKNPELALLAYNLGPSSTQEWINNGSMLSTLGKEALEYVPKVYKALGRTPEIFAGDKYIKALEKANRKN
jgi:hypothetical protein